MFGRKKEKKKGIKTVRWALHKSSVENGEVWLPENMQAVGITIEKVIFKKKPEFPGDQTTKTQNVFQVHYLIPED